MNSSVEVISEGVGVIIAIRELFGEHRKATLILGASACKGMLLRIGTGKVKHLTTTELWIQGAIQSYGVEVQKVPRAATAMDVLTTQRGHT